MVVALKISIIRIFRIKKDPNTTKVFQVIAKEELWEVKMSKDLRLKKMETMDMMIKKQRKEIDRWEEIVANNKSTTNTTKISEMKKMMNQ